MRDRPAVVAEFGPPTPRPFSKTLRFNCSVYFWSPGTQWLSSICVWSPFVMLIMYPIKANIKSAVCVPCFNKTCLKPAVIFPYPTEINVA